MNAKVAEIKATISRVNSVFALSCNSYIGSKFNCATILGIIIHVPYVNLVSGRSVKKHFCFRILF